MPITKSAKKALRQTKTRTVRNSKLKQALKLALKKASKETVSDTYSIIDKAVKNNIIHKNRGGRLKSRLSKKFGSPETPKKTSQKIAKKPKNKKSARV